MSMISLQISPNVLARVTAIDNLLLEIEAGAICGIIGLNGAGKLTTIRIRAIFTKLSSGYAFIGGHDVMAHPIEAKKLITVVLQMLNVDSELTSLEHLAVCYGMLFGMKRDLVSKAG